MSIIEFVARSLRVVSIPWHSQPALRSHSCATAYFCQSFLDLSPAKALFFIDFFLNKKIHDFVRSPNLSDARSTGPGKSVQ